MEKLQTRSMPMLLTSRLASLIDAGRLGAARPLLAAVRRIEPPSSLRLAMLSARLAMREKRFDLAQAELDAARGAVARTCRAAQVPGRSPHADG